jgi:hypothetical protein
MAVLSGPNLVRNGLILDLDVDNRKSFLRTVERSLINTNAWAVGQADGVGDYGANGSAGENARVLDTDPWGVSSVVWETRASGNNNDDGGWNTSYVTIDRTKLYRFSVWVRRTSSTSGGTFYLGTNSNGGVFSTQDGVEKGNPYWECSSTSIFTQNQWYLVCGHIYPSNTSYTGNHPDSGFYTISSGTSKVRSLNYCNIGSDLKWGSASTNAQHRCYHFYCADNTTRLQFADPRIDLCDGLEPSISELLNIGVTTIKDNSGSGNHHFLSNAGYVPTSNNPKRFNLDGSAHGIQRSGALNGVGNTCTVVIWYKTTDGLELWVRGNQNNGVYLSASNAGTNDNYYHSGVGTPTNFVDLNTVTNPNNPVNYRNGAYHMWEAKNVDFTSWTYFDWFLYPGGWQMTGDVSKILVYNRPLSQTESAQNYQAFRTKFGL